MQTTSYEEMRNRQRFDVRIKAVMTLPGRGNLEYQCRIVNLSGTGARLSVDKVLSVVAGMVVNIDAIIPGTIIHLTQTGAIVWVQQQGNATLLGIRFTENLSETMIHQFMKNSQQSDSSVV
jgi:hypothetical protein